MKIFNLFVLNCWWGVEESVFSCEMKMFIFLREEILSFVWDWKLC